MVPLSEDELHPDVFGIGLLRGDPGLRGRRPDNDDITRLTILDAAVEVAARQGDRIEMREIAARAGVSKAVLYRLYPTSVHLYAAVLDDELACFDRYIRLRLSATPDPARRLNSAILLLLAEMQGCQPVTEVLTHAFAAAQLEAPRQAEMIRHRTGEMFAWLLGEDIDRDRRGSVAAILTDVWAAELMAVVQQRRTYTDVRCRLHGVINLLARHAGDDAREPAGGSATEVTPGCDGLTAVDACTPTSRAVS